MTKQEVRQSSRADLTKGWDKMIGLVSFFYDRFLFQEKLPEDSHPIKILKELYKRSPRQALQGLKMAIADCIEMSSDWTSDQVRQVDNELAEMNALKLSDARLQYWKTLQKILNRREIKNDREYYILKSVAEAGPPESDICVNLYDMINRYENKRKINSKDVVQ